MNIYEIIRRLYAGHNISGISKTLTLDRKTVRSYIQRAVRLESTGFRGPERHHTGGYNEVGKRDGDLQKKFRGFKITKIANNMGVKILAGSDVPEIPGS